MRTEDRLLLPNSPPRRAKPHVSNPAQRSVLSPRDSVLFASVSSAPTLTSRLPLPGAGEGPKERDRLLPQLIVDCGEQTIDLTIHRPALFDDPYRVYHGRVVAPAEFLGDVGK